MDADKAESPRPRRGESGQRGHASAKSCPAIIWKLRKGERPTPTPSAQSARP